MVRGVVKWGVKEGEGRCGYGCREVCWGVWGGNKKRGGCGEMWEGVWGECGEVCWGMVGGEGGCGERCGGRCGKMCRVWGEAREMRES